MQDYYIFTIQKRKYSSNVLVGHYNTTQEIVLTTPLPKIEGDKLIENICELLNKQYQNGKK